MNVPVPGMAKGPETGIPTSETMLQCDHCMLPVKSGEALTEDAGGGKKIFCCHACRSIYRMIQQEGLGDFYAKRTWTSFGIPEPVRRGSTETRLSEFEGTEGAITGESDLLIDGIRCASCVWLNEKVLERTPGVLSARVNFATHRALVRWDPTKTSAEAILARIRSIGYLPHPYTPAALEQSLHRMNRDLLIRFGTAAFFSMQLMTISFALYAGYFQGIDAGTKRLLEALSFVLSTPVVLYAGWPFFTGAWRGLRHGTLNMDALIVLGSCSAYGLSVFHMAFGGEVYFDTAVMIITLVLLGRYLENSAKQRASLAVSRLVALQPEEGRVVRNGERIVVPTSAIRRGELLEVRPGEKIPLDGVVREGTSEVSEALISGESLPRPKEVGSAVIGSSLNGLGTILVEVTRTGPDTVISRIAALVERAQAASAPIQRLADRISAYFIPFIMLLAGASFWYWHSSVPHGKAVLIAVSVLVISCPCALGLATPVAILAGTGSAARKGILIKGGDILERMQKVDTVLLDKTGTLTTGDLRVVEAIPSDPGGVPTEELLQYAASVEQGSEHLLGNAIVRHARAESISLLPCHAFQAVPGKGASGMVNGMQVHVGKAGLIEEAGIVIPDAMRVRSMGLEEGGRTAVYVSRGRDVIGIIGLMDVPKADTAEAVLRLGKAHIAAIMITGDNPQTAKAIGMNTGISRVLAGVLPGEKAKEVLELRRAGKVVAMVGDGINDAPALASADVGIAMASGSDVAVESAHVVVLRSDLTGVADAFELARRTFRVIRQNLFWAFFYNICAIPLAMAGILSPIVAAAAMSVSSVTVVINSLRLKKGTSA